MVERVVIKRAGLGLLIGLCIGAGIAAGLHFGLGVPVASGLLMYLLAMGTGATAGVLAGKPPWRQAAWIEAILKAVAGMGFGALLVWLTSSYVPLTVPGTPLGLPADTRFADALLVILPMVAGLFGVLVGLDNTPDSASAKPRRVRVDAMGELDTLEIPEPGKKSKARRSSRD